MFYTNDLKNGVIFDLYHVLANSTPMHYEAWKIAFSETVIIEVNGRTIYLLEGVRGIELVNNILMLTGPKESDKSIVTQITKRKVEYFREVFIFKPFETVNELVTNLRCRKALVSGSSKKDVESILDVITADEVKNGKPDPSSLLSALEKLKLKTTGSIVVKNVPLDVEDAIRAGIRCIVVLNNTFLHTIFQTLSIGGENSQTDRIGFQFSKRVV